MVAPVAAEAEPDVELTPDEEPEGVTKENWSD